MEQVVGSPLGTRVIADPSDSLANRGAASIKSAASWAAIFAGAFVAISTTLILLALGSGLGVAALSPWPGRGASATEVSVNAVIWLIVTQWVSAALGGYIAGRLRTKWIGTHTHEVFFRDTAHGLVTWSVATVVVAAVLAGSVTSVVGGGLRALGGATSAGIQGAAAGGAATAASGRGAQGGSNNTPVDLSGSMLPGASAPMTYEIDKLFRTTRPAPSGALGSTAAAGAISPSGGGGAGQSGANTGSDARAGSDAREEAFFIALHAMANQGISDQDRAYLAQLVQAQSGISAQDAEKRSNDFIAAAMNAETKARSAADAARKAAAETAIYTALAMLIGAFIACVAAALGGRLRDEHL